MTPPSPPPPSEAELIAAVVEATLANQRKKHAAGQLVRRAFHPKSHGTVKARFSVRPDLPATLQIGLFARPVDYAALVRFSNGALRATSPDILPNIRGVAVKLLDVPGTKALPGEEQSTEHDFVLANHPVFFAPTIEPMRLFVTRQFKALFREHSRMPRLMLASMLKFVGNPLAVSYFSQVPYAWGDRACKYALVPAEKPSRWPLPNVFDRDFLRHAAERTLRRTPTRYHFCVQLQDVARDSLEDSTVAWTGPFIPVAELTFLPLQQPLAESDGEELSFNPWRVLDAHRPLGWPGRLRRAAYAANFRWRREQNRGS